MSLPPTIARALHTALGAPVIAATPLGGGSICRTSRVQLADGRTLLVKHHSSIAGLFTAERRGLELLRDSQTLRVPRVFIQQEAEGDTPAFLAMEWLGSGRRTPLAEEQLGIGLAQMHRTTATRYGLDHNNFIGANPQPNMPTVNWVTFFCDRRLEYQAELAARNGFLNPWRRRALETLCTRLDVLLPETPPASLLHGDLWGGNWLVTDSGEPALIDPAVYYGHRETDIAFTELFGGFSDIFYAAYNQTWPLEPGYAQRRDVYNLYHLLNHLNLFGEGYGRQVDAVLRRYAE